MARWAGTATVGGRPWEPRRSPRSRPLAPTLRRLFPLWWEQRRLVAIGLSFALAFTALSLAIPLLIKRVIDEAIVGTQDERLLPTSARSWSSRCSASGSTSRAASRPPGSGSRSRRGCAELLYHAYLRYPRAFYDRHATGEVISRATNDIYPVRYFIGWGVVQGSRAR